MVATLVTVGDWVADSEGDYGFTISDSGLQGLTDGVGVKRGEVRREGQHGSFDTPVFLESRVVSVSGKCWARSPQELRQYGIVLSGLGASGGRFRVVFQHGGQTLWGWARRGAQPLFEERPALGFAEWQYDFWLPDPFLYGETRTFTSAGSDVAAWHRGNTSAVGTIRVTGVDAAGYRIAHPGGSYRVTSAIAAGQTDVIDFRKGTLTKNGTLLDTAMTNADRFSVPGGRQVPFRVEPITSGASLTAVLSLPDTFV